MLPESRALSRLFKSSRNGLLELLLSLPPDPFEEACSSRAARAVLAALVSPEARADCRDSIKVDMLESFDVDVLLESDSGGGGGGGVCPDCICCEIIASRLEESICEKILSTLPVLLWESLDDVAVVVVDVSELDVVDDDALFSLCINSLIALRVALSALPPILPIEVVIS